MKKRYVKLTKQLSLNIIFQTFHQKGRQMADPRHRTPQGQSVVTPGTAQ